MKNFNTRSSHGHHGSKRRELAQHAHSRRSHALTHTLAPTQLQPRYAKCQLSYYIIWNQICNLKVPEGGGAYRSSRTKKTDSLPANRYGILEGGGGGGSNVPNGTRTLTLQHWG